jgi:hypothetical protein
MSVPAAATRGEADETWSQISGLLQMWANRGPLEDYWNDYKPAGSLLVSAERVAEARAMRGSWQHAALATPNSMREVEPSVRFRMVPALGARPQPTTTGASDGDE